jgi:sterol desaturase/sphingolipid hydroxylase (fatty acid hydroxylase superfamily)
MTADQVYQFIFKATLALLEPFLAMLRYDSPYFWPYALSFVGLALVIGIAEHARLWRTPVAFLKALLPALRVWWHPSARADYRFLIVNGILFPLIVGPLILSSAWLAKATATGLETLLGPPATLVSVDLGFRVALTIAFFLAYDLGRYLAHYALHEIPDLWEFHKVHHSAEVLTPFTNNRAHPVELWVMAFGANLLTGPVTGVFLYLAGGSVEVFTVYGLHAAIFVYNLFGNLRHSHVWLSYGPLGYLFISPAQHQIHHSVLPQHFGKNRGFALAIWDWLLGTLYVPRRRETFAMGLGEGDDARWHSVWQMYWRPIRLLWRRRAVVP